MDRLTIWKENGQATADCEHCRFHGEPCLVEPCLKQLLNRLAAYEDSGLEPEEIHHLSKAWEENETAIYYSDAIGGVSRLRDLVFAQEDGRLVVLPCNVGDTVYVIGGRRIVECRIDEVYLDDAKGVKYLVTFNCNENCDGCPFNDWHQDVTGEYSCSGAEDEAYIKESDFGKTVFLSHENAEAALKGETHDAI